MLFQKFANKAIGIVGIAEIGSSSDAAADAHGQHASLNAMEAEVTLAGLMDRRVITFPSAFFVPIVRRKCFIRSH